MRLGKHVRVRLKGINTVRRYRKDGSFALYRYHRATGTLLQGEPGSPEFLASYAAAERRRQERADGLSVLIRRFEESPEYAEMRESTRKEYRRKLKVVDRKWGTCPLPGLEDRAFRKDALAWRDGIAKRAPREADNLLSALARVLAFALERGELAVNVLDKVKRVYRSDRSEMIWLPEHITAFVRVAPAELVAAMMLGLHTGQREGDLLVLPWSAYDGNRITLRQSKGGRRVVVPCTAALRRLLDALERRSTLILTTTTGRTWKQKHFQHQWARYAAAAGIVDLHFHDLRGTAVTMLAEAGCTAPEIASITGHSLDHVGKILDVYLARTAPLAQAAIMKLERRAKRLQKGS